MNVTEAILSAFGGPEDCLSAAQITAHTGTLGKPAATTRSALRRMYYRGLLAQKDRLYSLPSYTLPLPPKKKKKPTGDIHFHFHFHTQQQA